MLATSRGIFAGPEARTCAWGRSYKPDATKRPVIVFTGDPPGGDPSDLDWLLAAASGKHIWPVLADVGIPMISAEFGGSGQWANDTTKTGIAGAWTQVKSTLNPKADKFIGIGISKGAPALEVFALDPANAGKLAAIVGIVPADDISDIYDNNRGGAAAGVDAAYGGNWAANKATHDPALNTTALAALNIPRKLISGANDTTVLASKVAAFGAAVGATVVNKAGTDHLTTAPAVDPVEDVLAFIAPYLT